MKGIFLKNWIVLLGGLRFNFIIMTVAGLVMSVCGVMGLNLFAIAFQAVFLCSMVMSLLEYNERSKWEIYCDALPVGRNGRVTGMYMFALSYFAAYAVLAMIVAAPFVFIFPQEVSPLYLLLLPSFTLILPTLMYSVLFPFLYKFSYKVFRVVLIVFLGALGGLGGFSIAMYEDYTPLPVSNFDFTTLLLWVLAAIAGSLILYFVSMLLSSQLYKTVEL